MINMFLNYSYLVLSINIVHTEVSYQFDSLNWDL